MSKENEAKLTWILIPVFLVLFVWGYNETIRAAQERAEAAAAAAELAERQAARQAVIDARTLNVEVQHDNDPSTNTISIALSATSSYDSENDEITYYWKQISGNNVADIRESRKESVLMFDGKAGDYGFELTVTDNYGESCVDTVLVEVAPEPNTCPVVIIKK